MPAHANTAAAWPTDIAGRQRHIHKGTIGAIVVVAPDEPLLIAEHGAPTLATLLRHRDPFRSLDDLFGFQTGDLGSLFDRGFVGGYSLVEISCRSGNEVLIDPAFLGNVSEECIE